MWLNKKWLIFAFTFCYFFSALAQAQPVHIVGQATIDTRGKKVKPKEVKKVKLLASVKALENFIQADQPKMRLYSQCLKSTIEQRISEFVNSSDVIRYDMDKAARQYTVVLKVSLNTIHLENVMESECKGDASQKARISFVFFAREKVKDGGYKTPEGNFYIDAKVKQVFLNNTFKPVNNNNLEKVYQRYSKSKIQQQYVETGEIDWSVIEESVIRNNSDYFSFGAFQIREATTDPTSGLVSSSVVVSAEVVDLHNDSTLGVVGPVQVRALGPTADDASTEALKLASEKLAKAIVSQLNAQHKH